MHRLRAFALALGISGSAFARALLAWELAASFFKVSASAQVAAADSYSLCLEPQAEVFDQSAKETP